MFKILMVIGGIWFSLALVFVLALLAGASQHAPASAEKTARLAKSAAIKPRTSLRGQVTTRKSRMKSWKTAQA